MEGEISKALKDLAKAIESNEAVTAVRVTITLTKPKPAKAKGKPEKPKS